MTQKTVKISRKALEDFIRKAVFSESWTGQDAAPRVINEPPMAAEPAVIDPKAKTQVADTDLPTDDPNWQPGNIQQLAMAMKQVAQNIPESQLAWFWPRLKTLIEKSISNTDATRAFAADLDHANKNNRADTSH